MSRTHLKKTTHQLLAAGQSPWLDSISRELLNSGKLKEYVEEKGVVGVTSNPTIFEKAISQVGGGYEEDIQTIFASGGNVDDAYDKLTVHDIQEACDLLKDVYESSQTELGFVRLEVKPGLAHDAEGTVVEALRLKKLVNRPNLMIKVPATPEGVKAFQTLTSKAVNVNVTLIFSQKQYEAILNAYIAGLETLHKNGGKLSDMHSVASIFVSRFDTKVDKALDEKIAASSDKDEKKKLAGLRGKLGVANAKMIYQAFEKTCSGERFKKLKAAGAFYQKVLWASTGVKNPEYSDLLYVENLVGKETVNTMPEATLEAVLDHGKIRPDAVYEDIATYQKVIDDLAKLGFKIDDIGETLQKEGLAGFQKSFDDLMKSIASHN